MSNPTSVERALVSDTGVGIVGVPEASTLIVAVTGVGAVHARAEQSQARTFRVTAMVEVEPALVVQVAKVVVTLTVIETSAVMVPYYSVSIKSIFFPLLLVDSMTVAQLLIAVPSELSAMAYDLVPHRPERRVSVST